MHFIKPFAPPFIAADSLVRCRVEVSVLSSIISPKNDAGNLPIRAFIQKPIHRRESEIAQTEFAPQTYSFWDIEI
jgi:hypothetical protein